MKKLSKPISKLTGKGILGKKKKLIQTRISMASSQTTSEPAPGPSGANTRKRNTRSPSPSMITQAGSLTGEISPISSPYAVKISGLTEDGDINQKKIGLDQTVRYSSVTNDLLIDEEIKLVQNITGIATLENEVFNEVFIDESNDNREDLETSADNMAREHMEMETSSPPPLTHNISPSPTPTPSPSPPLSPSPADGAVAAALPLIPTQTREHNTLAPPPHPNQSDNLASNLKSNERINNQNSTQFIPPPRSIKQELREVSVEIREELMQHVTLQIGTVKNDLTQTFKNELDRAVNKLTQGFETKLNHISNEVTNLRNVQEGTTHDIISINTNLEASNVSISNLQNTISVQDERIRVMETTQRQLENEIRMIREAPPPTLAPPSVPVPVPAPATAPQEIPEMNQLRTFFKNEDKAYYETTLTLRNYPDPGPGGEVYRATKILKMINSEHIIDQVKKISIRNNSLRLTFINRVQFDRATQELNWQLAGLNRNSPQAAVVWRRVFHPDLREDVALATQQGKNLKNNNEATHFEIIPIDGSIRLRIKTRNGRFKFVPIRPTTGSNSEPINRRASLTQRESRNAPAQSSQNEAVPASDNEGPPPPPAAAVPTDPPRHSTGTRPRNRPNPPPSQPRQNDNHTSQNAEKCAICQQDVTRLQGTKPASCRAENGHYFHTCCYDTIAEKYLFGCMLCTTSAGDPNLIQCSYCGPQARLLGDSCKKDIIKARRCQHTHLKDCQAKHRSLFNFDPPSLDNYEAHLANAFPACNTCLSLDIRPSRQEVITL